LIEKVQLESDMTGLCEGKKGKTTPTALKRSLRRGGGFLTRVVLDDRLAKGGKVWSFCPSMGVFG